MSLRATCTECNKTYRVPHADRAWHCKVCKSTLEIEAVEAAPQETECPSCGALFFSEETFCAECGETLVSPQKAKDTKKKARQVATKESRLTMRRVERLKTWVTANLVITGLWSVLVFALIYALRSPLLETLLGIGIQLVILGLAVLSRVFVQRRPFPVMLILASFSTLSTLFGLLVSLAVPELTIIFSGRAVFTLVTWFLTFEAAQVSRILRQNPDMYLAKKLRGEHRAHADDDDATMSDVRRKTRAREQAKQRQFWTRIAYAGAAVLVLAFGGFAYKVIAAPPSPEAALEEFRQNWNSVDREALVASALETKRPSLERSFRLIKTRYEWGEQLPALEKAEWKQSKPEKVRAYFSSQGARLRIDMVYSDGRWQLDQINPGELKHWRPHD